MYVCALCMLGAAESRKRELDPLGLEWQMAVSWHVGAGNQTWSSKKKKISVLSC